MTESILPYNQNVFSRAVRFAVACPAVCIGYFHLRLALGIQGFSSVYSDMLAGKSLPSVTSLVVDHHGLSLATSVTLLVAPLLLVFIKDAVRGLYLSGIAAIANMVFLAFLWSALTAPLVQVIKGMQSA